MSGDSAMRPTLVLLPGMDGTGELFRPLLEVIGTAWPVNVVSYPVGEVLSYEQLVDHAQSCLPGGPLILLGESFSGPIAATLAASLSDRVRRPSDRR